MEFLVDLMKGDDLSDLQKEHIDWHVATWLPQSSFCTKAVVVNDFFRNWGHQFIYDRLTLPWALEVCGFKNIEEMPINQSRFEPLQNLENERRMPPGLLQLATMTFEALKPLWEAAPVRP